MSSHRHEDIFISFRYTESLTEACVLKNVLESKGISVYINDSHSGVNMAAEIAEKLEKCTLVVIMGTETYGVKTKSINSTFEELQFIYENKQFFLVKMCREFKVTLLYANNSMHFYLLISGGSGYFLTFMKVSSGTLRVAPPPPRVIRLDNFLCKIPYLQRLTFV